MATNDMRARLVRLSDTNSDTQPIRLRIFAA